MRQEDINKRVYDVEYKKMKEAGYPFHPFATWKDIIVAFVIVLLLFLATAVWGVHYGSPANPTSQFLPRPEWYFMFLFQMLKYFPGFWAILPVAVIPGVLGAALLLLPFYDRNPYRHWKRRPWAVGIMLVVMGLLTWQTLQAYWDDAKDEHAVQLQEAAHVSDEANRKAELFAGPDGAALFAANCTVCHGAAGTQIPNVALLDKAFLSTRDVVAVVTNGNTRGMPAFKGKLQPEEIKAIADHLTATAK